MQHIKITENIGKYKRFIYNDNKTGLCLEDTLKFFDIQRIFGIWIEIFENSLGNPLLSFFLFRFTIYFNMSEANKQSV